MDPITSSLMKTFGWADPITGNLTKSFSNFWGGTPEKTQQFSTLSQDSQNLQGKLTSGLSDPMAQMLQQLMGYLNPNQQSYEQFEKPLMRQFNEQIVPGIAEAYGGLNASSSSGAQQTMAHAGTDLMERLGAQRGQLQQGSMDRVIKMLQLALNPTQETVITGRQQGGAEQGMAALARMIPYLLAL